MPDNNDYVLTVFSSDAFANNKAYKILREKYSKTDPDKTNNANFRLEYIAKAAGRRCLLLLLMQQGFAA